MTELRTKTAQAIARIEAAYEIAEQRGERLVVAYSGGKDSDVLLDLALKSEVPILVQHNHTTVDAPETVYHIREVFARLDALGVATEINFPPDFTMPDGTVRRTSMWNLIVKKGMPPTQMVRYCCEVFKERNFDGQHIMTGVRWEESPKRSNRGLHEAITKKAADRVVYVDENDDEHKLQDICFRHKRIVTNPIIDWSDADVWLYVRSEKLKMNPLYGLGHKRVGCVACPMAGRKQQELEFRLYPTYKAAYIRAFDKMLKVREARGLPPASGFWADGQGVFDWWVGRLKASADDAWPGQTTFFDDEEEPQ